MRKANDSKKQLVASYKLSILAPPTSQWNDNSISAYFGQKFKADGLEC